MDYIERAERRLRVRLWVQEAVLLLLVFGFGYCMGSGNLVGIWGFGAWIGVLAINIVFDRAHLERLERCLNER